MHEWSYSPNGIQSGSNAWTHHLLLAKQTLPPIPAHLRVTSWLTSIVINDPFIWNIIWDFDSVCGNFQYVIKGAVDKETGDFHGST